MKKILVTGINAHLGHDVIKELNKREYEPVDIVIKVNPISTSEYKK